MSDYERNSDYINHKLKGTLAKYLNKLDKKRTWKKIPNYNGYLASDLGEILTIKTGNFTKGASNGDYLKVSLINNENIRRMEYVQILIASAFKKRKKGENVVLHLDDDKFNNAAINLKYGTQSKNIQDAYDRGLILK